MVLSVFSRSYSLATVHSNRLELACLSAPLLVQVRRFQRPHSFVVADDVLATTPDGGGAGAAFRVDAVEVDVEFRATLLVAVSGDPVRLLVDTLERREARLFR